MTTNLGRALPPLIWTKSKRTAVFFRRTSLTAVLKTDKKNPHQRGSAWKFWSYQIFINKAVFRIESLENIFLTFVVTFSGWSVYSLNYYGLDRGNFSGGHEKYILTFEDKMSDFLFHFCSRISPLISYSASYPLFQNWKHPPPPMPLFCGQFLILCWGERGERIGGRGGGGWSWLGGNFWRSS